MSGSSARFITLEGVEGCGKSLQSRLLEERLRASGLPCLHTRQPGGTRFGQEVRDILLHSQSAPREPIAELLLYLADRYQSLKETIEPALAGGRHVVCDRYHDATLAYQGHARGIGFGPIDRIAEILDLRKPDLTIVLDIEVEVGLRRAKQRQVETSQEHMCRFEAEEMEFHRRVREGYRLLRRREPERIRFLDADGTPQAVLERICRLLESSGVIPCPLTAQSRP